MSFGSPDWQSWVLDEEKALPLLKAAYDRGLNTWDTGRSLSPSCRIELFIPAFSLNQS
jgi:aryl-alcohol dehydrogenase-like predicted oxidoreductase